MMQKVLSASYGGYTIKQRYSANILVHDFYSNDAKQIGESCSSSCIFRSTKKQLYRYLRYLVNSGIINKLESYCSNNGKTCFTSGFNELNGKSWQYSYNKPATQNTIYQDEPVFYEDTDIEEC